MAQSVSAPEFILFGGGERHNHEALKIAGGTCDILARSQPFLSTNGRVWGFPFFCLTIFRENITTQGDHTKG